MQRWLALVLTMTAPSAAAAAEVFCNPVDLCSLVPKGAGGAPAYNHTDGTRPWVIGQNEVVSLTAGEHAVGGLGDFKTVFVIENGTLEIKDVADWAGFGAFLILCGDATFRVKNAGFRSLADRSFQYPIYAYDRSKVEYTDARFYTLKQPLEAAGKTGHLLQVMGGSSTFTATKAAAPASVQFPNSNGAFELAATQSSTVDVQSMWTIAELYVQGKAKLSVSDSFFFDVFFEVCATDDYALDSLPALCDLKDAKAGCMTAGHQPLDFSLAPPTTPFTLTLKNDRVFSWAVSTYAGSKARVRNAPPLANLAVGVGGVRDDLSIKLTPGPTPTFSGLTDRSLDLQGSAVMGGWMLWPVGTSKVTVLPGSEIADVLPGDTSFVDVQASLLQGAMFMTTPGTSIRITDTQVKEGAANEGGKLWAVRSSFEAGLRVNGPTWLADTALPADAVFEGTSALLEVALTAPVEGFETFPASIPITGRVKARTPAGDVAPFPDARLEVLEKASGKATTLASLSAAKDGALGTWDASGASPGTYELRLFFVGTDGERAVSRRTVTIKDRCAGVTCPPPGACHDSGTCDPATGSCTPRLKAQGAACSDGDACTTSDSCDGKGACVPGAAVVCAASGTCFEAGVCDSATGACSTVFAKTGKACDDGDGCTSGETCDGEGRCAGGTKTCGAPEPDPSKSGCGCSFGAEGPASVWALVVLGLRRRRR